MRRIVWSVDAAREYREIIAYIAEDEAPQRRALRETREAQPELPIVEP